MFDFVDELPFQHIQAFCVKFVSDFAKKALFQKALEICNESFRIPFLCTDIHPKILAAASVALAVEFRIANGLEGGVAKEIHGYPWFKWIDSAIEHQDVDEVA